MPTQNMYMNVHSRIIYNQMAETTQMNIKWWMDKQNMVCPYSGTLYGQERNEVPTHATTWIETFYKWKKPITITTDHVLYDSMYIKSPEWGNIQRQIVEWFLLKGERRFSSSWRVQGFFLSRWKWSKPDCDCYTTSNMLETTGLYILNGWFIWYVNFISIKMLQ